MKRVIVHTILMVVIIFFVGQNAKSQNIKFGHINSDELIQAMPEFDLAQVALEKFRKELLNFLELMSVELNNKNDAYRKEFKNLSDIVKQVKEQELSDLNRRIQEFQTTAQTQFQEKQGELFQPIYAKVEKAIKDVGKENDYLYIFNSSQGGSLLFFNKEMSADVTTLVKAKLKIR
jgi:outer membrane protein